MISCVLAAALFLFPFASIEQAIHIEKGETQVVDKDYKDTETQEEL